MSFANQLIHTCTIENAAAGAPDAHGNEERMWESPLENVRCRLVESRERVWSDERGESTVQTWYMLFVNATVNLNKRARISKITLEDGTEVYGTFTATEVMTRRGRNSRHKMATLERIA